MDGLNYHYKYPHPSVTTDCVVFGYDGFRLNVLLVERGREPHKGKWAFPGGFLEIDEAAEDGALRELYEETGLSSVDLRQFHSFTEPRRDPRERVISIAYYALVSMRALPFFSTSIVFWSDYCTVVMMIAPFAPCAP